LQENAAAKRLAAPIALQNLAAAIAVGM